MIHLVVNAAVMAGMSLIAGPAFVTAPFRGLFGNEDEPRVNRLKSRDACAAELTLPSSG